MLVMLAAAASAAADAASSSSTASNIWSSCSVQGSAVQCREAQFVFERYSDILIANSRRGREVNDRVKRRGGGGGGRVHVGHVLDVFVKVEISPAPGRYPHVPGLRYRTVTLMYHAAVHLPRPHTSPVEDAACLTCSSSRTAVHSNPPTCIPPTFRTKRLGDGSSCPAVVGSSPPRKSVC